MTAPLDAVHALEAATPAGRTAVSPRALPLAFAVSSVTVDGKTPVVIRGAKVGEAGFELK